MFFVSVDSTKVSYSVSSLFLTLTSKSTSVDSKGLALRQKCAEWAVSRFVFKRIRRVALGWRDLISRLTGGSTGNRAGLPECDYTSGLLKVKRKSGSGQFPVSAFIRRMVELSYCLAHHLIDTLGVLLRNNQTGHLEACPRSPMR